MADSAYTLPALASKGTRLALALYDIAATIETASKDVGRAATGIGSFSRTAKQLDFSLKDDESIPTSQALEVVQSIIHQALQIFDELEGIFPVAKTRGGLETRSWKWGLSKRARMEYLLEHLDSLRLTSATMIQSFNAVNIKRLSKQQRDYAVQKATDYVQDEEMQLENLVIEQQQSILRAFSLHDEYERSEAFSGRESEKVLLPLDSEKMSMSRTAQGFFVSTERPRSVAAKESQEGVSPVDGQSEGRHILNDGERSPRNKSQLTAQTLSSFRASALPETLYFRHDFERLAAIRQASTSHANVVLDQWTRLREIEERIQRYAAQVVAQKRLDYAGKQASVETALPSEDESEVQAKTEPSTAKIAAPVPRRSPSTQSILSQPSFVAPIPVPGTKTQSHLNPPSYPASPRSSFASTTGYLPVSPAHSYKSADYSPQSPRSSLQSIPPIQAAAAAIKKEPENGDDLEIPWRLCLHNSYWDYIDSRCVDSNTHLQPSEAYTHRKGYTELLASWVCRQALDEAHHDHMQVQKPDASGRKFDTVFIVHKPLRFADVEHLVERTIQIIQEKSEQPRPRQESHRRQGSQDRQTQSRSRRDSKNGPPMPTIHQHPPLDRSLSLPVAPMLTPHIPASPRTSFHNVAGQPYMPYLTPNTTPQYTLQRGPANGANGRGPPSPVVSDTPSSDSEEERRDRRRAARKSKKTSSRSHSAMGTMAKIGGALAILEGLEHAF